MESDSNLGYLFAVFLVTWAVFFSYVLLLARRQRDMQREIEVLTSMLSEDDGGAEKPEVSY